MEDDLVISLHDPQGKVIWANQAPFPATMDELLGSYPWDWVVQEEKVDVKRYFAHCLSLREPQVFTANALVHEVPMLLQVRIDATGGPALPAICRVRVIDPRTSLLTETERRILTLTGKALDAKQIAKQLGLQHSTVDTIRWRVKKKLGVRNLLQLTIWASRNLP